MSGINVGVRDTNLCPSQLTIRFFHSRSLHKAADIFPGCSAYGQAVDFNCRNTNTNGYGLSVLAASANAFVELQVIAHHRDTSEHIGPVSDQGRSFDGRGDLAVLDQI